MPITPFIGVRISWLMLARNSLLALLATSTLSAIFWVFSVASCRSWFAAANSWLVFSSLAVRSATIFSNSSKRSFAC